MTFPEEIRVFLRARFAPHTPSAWFDARALAVVALALVGGGSGADAATIEARVRDELAASPDGRAYVLVLLAGDATDVGGSTLRPRAWGKSVLQRQRRVLDRMGAEAFQLRHRYSTVAALSGRVTAAGLERLAADPDVALVGADESMRPGLAATVPFLGADRVHALGIRGDGITVAVLDTGVETGDADLADDMAEGAYTILYQGTVTGPGAEDQIGHGTAVAGIISSKGVVAPPGVAPDTDILALRVIDFDSGWLSDLAAGVDYVVAHRNDYDHLAAINISLGSQATYSQCPCDGLSASNILLQDAISAAKDAGIPSFAISGNDGSTTTMWSPGCLSAATSVTSVRGPHSSPPDQISTFSSRNACTRLAAPGEQVVTSVIGAGTTTGNGTSMAGPHVSAVAALVAQARDDVGLPRLSPDDLVALLEATGHPVTDPLRPPPHPIRVDALRAVDGAVPPVAQVVAPNGGEFMTIGQNTLLQWNASDNVGIAEVEVALSRTGAGGPFEVLATLPSNPGSYLWPVTGPGTLQAFVRVTARDTAGSEGIDLGNAPARISVPVGVSSEVATGGFALAPPVPNPSAGRWSVEFTLPRRAPIRLAVFDVQGRLVDVLASGAHDPGAHRLQWNGGGVLASGSYTLRMEYPGGHSVRRFTIVR